MKNSVYHCPVEVSMEVLGGAWTTVLLAHIKEGPRRFSELQRLVPDISDKMLTQRLQRLETEGLVTRTVVKDRPAHVVYDLTDAGNSLRPVLDALYQWGRSWAAETGVTVEPPVVL